MLPRWFANLFAGFRPGREGPVPAPATPQARVVASFPPGLSPEEHRRLVERAKLLHELMEREHR